MSCAGKGTKVEEESCDIVGRFHPRLRRVIRGAFRELTGIQRRAIPVIMEGKNALLIAPTGSGKTEAAFLPILDKLIDKEGGIHALYIAPLRSLNRDMLRRMEEWGRKIGIRMEVRHGDTTQSQRSRQRAKPPSILITTPETLQALLPAPVMRKHLANVKYVIIDEIHELVSDKRGTQLAVALERLHEISGNFQRIGLSATVGNPEIVSAYFGLERVIQDTSEKRIKIVVERPRSIIERIAGITGKKATLVFTNTRVATELLTKRLREIKEVEIHHSSLSKEKRIEAERGLKEGRIKTLVCTSSMELGIDVGEIEQIIQISSPRQVARLLQRVGRSGHAMGRVSNGRILCSDFDDVLEGGVIAKRGLDRKIEKTEFFEKSLDVLAHQIVGLVLEYRSMKLGKIYEIIRRAYPYRRLRRDEFNSVVDVLKNLRLIGWEGDLIRRRRGTLLYYYGNLSTIPTYNRYTVIDLSSHKPIGVLDEEYIIDCNVNSIFILKGEAWRVVDFRERRVLVVPVSEIGAEVPVWVGEDIPVPYDVAIEVGRERRRLANGEEVDLPLNPEAVEFVKRIIEKQKRAGEVPTDQVITIERIRDRYDQVVVNACFGTKVNATLGRVLASLLGSKYGEGIGINADAYRIILTGMVVKGEDVMETLLSINPEGLREILEKVVAKTNLFRFAFAHVGKRFGVFKNDVNFREINITRVIESYRGTAVYREALSEVFKKYFDLPNSTRAVRRIQEGKIKIIIQAPTPISQLGLEEFRDVVQAERPERAIMETVRNRLLTKKVNLVCLHCGFIMRNRSISTLKYPISCPKCESWMIAYGGRKVDEISRIVRGGVKNRTEARLLSRAEQSAGLIHTYEKRALLALNARGVGPRTATRILELDLDEESFFKELLRAEREFVRTSRFWRGRERRS